MSRGIRISKMRVHAFRGISDSIEFDLSSPLTVVFAPNGTGKTTLCEAAEWLLTGQVDRLREGKDFDARVLRSRFATDSQLPLVTADISVRGELVHLVRKVASSGDEASLSRQGGNQQLIRPNDLLAYLAPSAAAQETHHLRAINLRQQWIRGTRFLTAEALAALVDSDDKTIERRTQVFADLLGIRHLLDAEGLCDKYIAELGSRERELDHEIAGLESEIDALKKSIASTQSNEDQILTSRSELEKAERILGIPADAFTREIPQRIEATAAEYGGRKYVVERRRANLEAVIAEWDAYDLYRESAPHLEANEQELLSQLSQLEVDERATIATVANYTSQQTAQYERAQAVEAARDSLSLLVNSLVSALASDDTDTLLRTPFATLIESMPECRWTRSELQRKAAEIQAAFTSVETDKIERHRMSFVEAQLSALLPETITTEEMTALRDQVDRLEQDVEEASRRLEATTAPLNRLQVAALDFFKQEHAPSLTNCPLCGHDWEAPEALKNAISATFASFPELASISEELVNSTTQALRVARERLASASKQISKVQQLQSELYTLKVSLDERAAVFHRLGASGPDWIRELEALQLKLLRASALSELMREHERFIPTLPGAPEPLLAGDTPVNRLRQQLTEEIATRELIVQVELATIANELEKSEQERDRLRTDRIVAQAQLKDCREQLALIRPELARLRAVREQLAPEAEWSEIVVEVLNGEISQEEEALEQAATFLAAAKSAWLQETRRARIDEIRGLVGPRHDKLEKMRHRLNVAKRAKAAFRQTYNEVSKQQIVDLSRVVNPLFARMHANRVIDRIKLGRPDEPLKWLADAGNQQMDPAKDFSQGQRQDLALALFLGRARSLGGTFFLDEPVTHLDDLNRVGLLDIFRATVLESSSHLNLIVTTASRSLARHMVEKFSMTGKVQTPEGSISSLKVIELTGNGRAGVDMQVSYQA